jgi:hypothetical protein
MIGLKTSITLYIIFNFMEIIKHFAIIYTFKFMIVDEKLIIKFVILNSLKEPMYKVPRT